MQSNDLKAKLPAPPAPAQPGTPRRPFAHDRRGGEHVRRPDGERSTAAERKVGRKCSFTIDPTHFTLQRKRHDG